MKQRVAVEVRRATPADLDALASLRPWVHDEHARRILYFDQIAVTESDRGRGHGRRLIEAGVALARELGIGIVELDVYAFNAKARAFFLSQGFEPQRERLCRVLTDRTGR
jgi:ribosomal protein S18 acetylase RimI-like enzyme